MLWRVCLSSNLMQGLNCWYAWTNSISLYCSMVYPCIIERVARFLTHWPCWCTLLFWRFVLPWSDTSSDLIYRFSQMHCLCWVDLPVDVGYYSSRCLTPSRWLAQDYLWMTLRYFSAPFSNKILLRILWGWILKWSSSAPVKEKNLWGICITMQN